MLSVADTPIPSTALEQMIEARGNCQALLDAMNDTFGRHASRTGKPLLLVRTELMNGVLP